ncbi:FAD-dependent oxidoreductase [Bacteroidota bacterium]
MKKIFLVAIMWVCFAHLKAQTVLIETEAFQEKGGWIIDNQFIDQMGSSYLLAHGAGRPVQDAHTIIEIPVYGKYNIWVRTFNWNAPWDPIQAPGTFKVLINGIELNPTFGTSPDRWDWVKGGQISLKKRSIEIRLKDLTGFEGRCDAILLTTDDSFTPPNEDPEMINFRRKLLNILVKPIDKGEYDLVVVGGGVAGISAAVSAARLGLKTALIQNRPVLGGNNSPEIKVVIQGGINLGPYPNMGNVVGEIGNTYEDHNRTLRIVQSEPNLELHLSTHVYDAEVNNGQITAVIARNVETNVEYRFGGKLFADCTGDGNVGFAAGADYTDKREIRSVYGETLAPEIQDNFKYGATLKWNARDVGKAVTYPETPWAVQFSEVTAQKAKGATWDWETGWYHDMIDEFEYIRDYWFRVVYGNFSFLKNKSVNKLQYENFDLVWVGFVPGKRESRRLLGDVILKQQDIEGEWKQFPDSAVIGTYSIDQHFPHPENSLYFPGEEFRAIQKHNYNKLGPVKQKIPGVNINKPYMIPYRCLYSRNIDNLFMAGRDISVSRIAMTSVRVQGTTGMMGEAVGIAASLCVDHECLPRDIYSEHLEEYKESLLKGVYNKEDLMINPDPFTR